MAARKRNTALQIRIVFDTNALYNNTPTELLTPEVYQFIIDNKKHDDISLEWYLPEMVVLERRHQMLIQARQLMSPLKKLERLIGHNLNITDDMLPAYVDAAIKSQMDHMGLQQLTLDVTRVDWRQVALNAVTRAAPFANGNNEKGFRDCLIGETFLQLRESSPPSAQRCRIVFVSADQRLGEMVAARTQGSENSSIVTGIEALQGLVNTLASNVTEAFVAKYRVQSQALFFSAAEHKTSLFYSASVRETVMSKFGANLTTPPPGATSVKMGGWLIDRPEFESKKGQRITWKTRILVPLTAHREETQERPNPWLQLGSSSEGNTPQPFSYGPSSAGAIAKFTYPFEWKFVPADLSTAISTNLFKVYEPPLIEVRSGKAAIDIKWSVTVKMNGQLSGPAIDDILFSESNWE